MSGSAAAPPSYVTSSPRGSSTTCISSRCRSCSGAASVSGTAWRAWRMPTTSRPSPRRAASPTSRSGGRSSDTRLTSPRTSDRWFHAAQAADEHPFPRPVAVERHDGAMKHIGFLSFGHWSPSPQSRTRSASDALLQSIDLAVAAEEVGADGAYFRVHHFARQLSAPFPLLAAVGARTSRIEIGTGVIDMRYENPLYMAEDAATADLIAGGRLQLGISRGSPEQVIDGFRYFGYQPAEGSDHADMAREHARIFLDVIRGEGFAEPNPRPMFPNPPGLLPIEPHSPGLRDRIGWGAGPRATAEWTGQQGMNLMSSALLTEDTGVPFHQPQAEQITRFRDAWTAAGHPGAPRVSVSRSIFPLVDDTDRAYFGREATSQDQVGRLEGGLARFGKSYAGEPDQLVKDLAVDEAIEAADTLLLTVPNQLGVDYNVHVIDSVLRHVAPELGWR